MASFGYPSNGLAPVASSVSTLRPISGEAPSPCTSSEGVDSESKVSGNQTTVPAWIRRALDTDDGDTLRWRTEENSRFHIDAMPADAFATAKALFRRYEPFSLADACPVACMQAEDIDYLLEERIPLFTPSESDNSHSTTDESGRIFNANPIRYVGLII